MEFAGRDNTAKKKPEHLTQLSDGCFVAKDHPRIVFRGKLDTLHAQTVLLGAQFSERQSEGLISELGDLAGLLVKIMHAEVLGEELGEISLMGLTAGQLHDRSHHPEKYYGVKTMILPVYTLGSTYAALNLLRAQARETELAAVGAFVSDGQVTRADIITALNRLSSAVYLMMCKCLSGGYAEKRDATGK